MKQSTEAPWRNKETTFRKIAILRALQLGDLLCSVPALRALRAAYPGAEITLLGLPWAADFVRRFSAYLDRFIEFPGFPGLPEREFDPEGFTAFLSEVQAARFDLVLQLHGSGRHVNYLVMLFGAREVFGFYNDAAWVPDPRRFIPYPADDPEIRRQLRLVQFLGAEPKGEALEFPVSGEDELRLERLLETYAGTLLRAPVCCIHPGARSTARRWPARKFAEVADRLSESGLSIAITGTSEESGICQEVLNHMCRPAHNLCGKTDIGALGALIGRSALLICNDTAVSHIAAALGTPSAVVFEGPEFKGWPPLNRRLHRFICLTRPVEPSDVLEEALDVLRLGKPADSAPFVPSSQISERRTMERLCRNSAS